MNRREFSRLSMLGVAGGLLPILPGCKEKTGAAMINNNVRRLGLQLWTVRREIEKDLQGTLNRVAELGYRHVESAFWPDHISIEEGARALTQAGISVFSIHSEIPVEGERDNILQMVENYNCRTVIWHGWPEDPRNKSDEGLRELIDIYGESQLWAQAEGLTFGLHNHWWEFEPWEDGTLPFVKLLETLDEDIFFELDTYWIKVAGQDPAKMVEKFGPRAKMLHIKDGPGIWHESLDFDDPDPPLTPAGQGVQDFPAIGVAAAENVEWMIFEMDNCACDVFDALKQSREYLLNEGIALI